MKALISPLEQRETGYRVSDVHPSGFEIAQPMFWIDCSDDVVADLFWYDPSSKTLKPMPEPELIHYKPQPIVQGAQQL